jgi:hypothetical protein
MLNIEDEFSSEEIDLIHEAADEWYNVTGSDDALIFFRYGYHLDHPFSKEDAIDYEDLDYPILHKVSVDDPGYLYIKERREKLYGSSSGFGGFASEGLIVGVVKEYYSKDNGYISRARFGPILRHEFAHFVGLMDHADMGKFSSETKPYGCIDQFTIDNFCDMWGSCKDNHQGTCK